MSHDNASLPDFIIPGAMKSGTTSMHRLLADHPDVFIPEDELFFFSMDDMDEHSDHYVHADGEWMYPDWERNFDQHFSSYQSHYEDADPGLTWGEDSTTYLTSRKAPARIAEINSDVKFVVMLRDPVDRTYSHYWHELRNGYSFNDFETAIERTPGTLLKRSMYARGLKRFFRYFDAEQFTFVFFQDFVRRQQDVVDDVCEFLGLSPDVTVEGDNGRKNVGGAPMSVAARRMENYFFRRHIDRPSISDTTDWIADMEPPN